MISGRQVEYLCRTRQTGLRSKTREREGGRSKRERGRERER